MDAVTVKKACENYFKPLTNPIPYSKKNAPYRFGMNLGFFALKTLSYLTVVVPLIIGATLFISTKLAGRVKPLKQLPHKVTNIANKVNQASVKAGESKSPTQIPSLEKSELPPGGQLKGLLGTAFKWPSDHFPIAGTIQLGNNTTLHFVSYNVLKQDYLKHITNDAQGLNGSDITSMQKDAREARICNQIVEMLNAGHDVLALQECSDTLREKLAKALPPAYKIAVPQGKNNEGPCIYNSNKYSIEMKHDAPYTNHGTPVQNKYINTFELTSNDTSEKIRIVNTHVQIGNADVLGRHIAGMDHSSMSTLVVGDMNAPSSVIEKALGDQVAHTCISRELPTHINTHKKLIDYDQIHLITHPGTTPLTATASTRPDDIFGSGSDLAKELQELHNVLKARCEN